MRIAGVPSASDLGPLPDQEKSSPLRLVIFYSRLNLQSLTAASTGGLERAVP